MGAVLAAGGSVTHEQSRMRDSRAVAYQNWFAVRAMMARAREQMLSWLCCMVALIMGRVAARSIIHMDMDAADHRWE